MSIWDKTRQTTIRQSKTRQINIIQHNIRLDKQDQTISDNITQDKTRQYNTTQHNTIEAKARQM